MMPRNVLMIGNSHTAAPRVALREHPERWPGFEPDIFGMPGHTLGALELRDGGLVPRNDDVGRKMMYYNGILDLPLVGYDAFVVIGCLNFHLVAELQHDQRSIDFPSFGGDGSVGLISTALMDALVRQRIAQSPALRMVRLLAGLGQGPVLFLDTVFPSAECVDDPQGFAPHVEMARRGDAAAFHARYLRLLHEELEGHATHVPQPGDTIVDQVFTAPQWMRGSVRMQPRRDVLHEDKEYGHANPEYGARQVDLIAGALAGS